MGYAPYYQAIAENSELLRLLRTDRQLTELLGYVFTLGSRPLDLDETGEDELNDALDWLVRNSIAVNRQEAEAILLRLRTAIAEADRVSPGLLDRCRYVEKTQYEIESRLGIELEKRGVENASDLAAAWINGDSVLVDSFRLVSSATVASAAALLRNTEPEQLFGGEREDYIQDDYRACARLISARPSEAKRS